MIIILLGAVGLALGSFINALVWRLYLSEQPAKKTSSKHNFSIFNGRSMCVHCKHVLAWYDLIPVISWLQLKGRCRYCKKRISGQYPVIELLMAVLLVISYFFWPLEFTGISSYILFAIWAIILTCMLALAIYDLKWMILPTNLILISGIMAAIFMVLHAFIENDSGVIFSGITGALGLGGLFWLIYQLSKGTWIGGGDVRYGFAMGLLLGWQKAIFGLTAAAYIGLLVIIIIAMVGKYHRKMKIPFGPMLIAATFISVVWGQYFIDIYKGLSGL
jgi:prepilin signal peptidase PulO-like enzyme (type II secretory pathway)